MKKPHDTYDDHPSAEELAAFVDRAVHPDQATRLRTHLDHCAECMETYQFVLRSKAAVSPTSGPSREDIEKVLRYAEPSSNRALKKSPRLREWLAGRRIALGSAVVAVVVVSLVAALTLNRPGPALPFDPDSAELKPVTLAMISSSERRPMIIPGVEHLLEVNTDTRRSGAATATEAFDRSMSSLIEDYHDDQLSNIEIRWIIGGYLATLQIENARAFIEDVRSRMGGDPDFLVLVALLAYDENDLVEARHILQKITEKHPNNQVALYDLAVVLNALDDQDAATALLEKLRSGSSGTPIAERASRLIEKMGSEF